MVPSFHHTDPPTHNRPADAGQRRRTHADLNDRRSSSSCTQAARTLDGPPREAYSSGSGSSSGSSSGSGSGSGMGACGVVIVVVAAAGSTWQVYTGPQ